MPKPQVKQTFTVTAPEDVMARFMRLLWMMQYSSSIGHSAYFGMPLDGDGSDRFYVQEIVDLPQETKHAMAQQYEEANMSGGVELAFDGSFGSRKLAERG
jgi:hypothetical protein